MRQIYTVSQLNTRARTLLEGELGLLWLSGELSNFKSYGSGHWYFSLKDERSQVSCAMFRGKNMAVTFAPRDGMQLLVRARPTVYEPRGSYQLVVEFMEPAGDGLLKQQFDALKLKLASEGLFADANKVPLPAHPKRIGVISSASGAAVHDILTVLKRRAPFLEVVLYPAKVQGQQSAQELCTQLARAVTRAEVDVLIIGRGGGSLEDLWSFNDEALARAIAACPIPIVSAVGHETDVTISDFVADVRAATPSAAAELVSAQAAQIQSALAQLSRRLASATARQLQQWRQRQQALGLRLGRQQPGRKLERDAQRRDELQQRLQRALPRYLARGQQQLQQLQARLQRQHPGQRLSLANRQQALAQLALQRTMSQQLASQRQRLQQAVAQLQLVSPLATLSRGYSITQNDRGEVIDSIAKVSGGDSLQIRVRDGIITANATGSSRTED
ncbi:exodeoxyribonuclease VII large subunit [Gallaecimonas sp. GXIMD1310]|uniref:exodeoxyribonuclease VII large subunit n=1 Tax=Gallaecimonas sp. GXIMD1310 TaxID=3131926 RepID=UPI00325267AB